MDYYRVLGVKRDATQQQIRTAYMKRAVEVHPDRNPSDSATQEFQQLADAYYVLSDPQRRQDYDRTNQHMESDADADDVFGDVFEDLLRDEMAGWPVWGTVGMVCGGGLGFILANLPGLFVGGLLGKKVGSVRDRSGRPVLETFNQMQHSEKLRVLTQLAAVLYRT